MTTSKRHMHLMLFINPTGHHQASWRHQDADADAGISFQHYLKLAKEAEEAGLDALFLADNQCVRPGEPEVVGRVAQYVANLEPLTLVSALAAATETVGFIVTASTSYNYPFQIARKFASLDHISNGRVAWNIVTSGFAAEALNFNRDDHFEHELRYERADEFVRVCQGLWDSWEDDAFPRDKESGWFSLPDKMHVLNHVGQHFQVRGPLNVPRSPQGRPVLVQAGASTTGTRFAARHAEIVFVTPQTLKQAQSQYREIKELAVEFARDPHSVLVTPGLTFVVGRTTAEAEEDFERLQSLLSTEVALNLLSAKLGGTVDLTAFNVNEPLPLEAEPESEKLSGRPYFRQWAEIGKREGLTLEQLARKAAGSFVGAAVRGSAVDIADLMEDWFSHGGADGFNLQPAYLPGQFTRFTELVMPELRQRGLLSDPAERGTTLRRRLELQRPPWQDWTGASTQSSSDDRPAA